MAAERPPIGRPPKLLDRMRLAIRLRHLSDRTEESYVAWARRFILFHDKRHPKDMGADQVVAFLSDLAVERRVSASTQNQALAALVFLYRHVLDRELEGLDTAARAKRSRPLPVVLSREEVRAVLAKLRGTKRLQATLLYGGGLRLMECLRLRIKDLDPARGQLTVRQGKGRRDRMTTLSRRLRPRLTRHLDAVHDLHRRDLAAGCGAVPLPDALGQKFRTRTGNGPGNGSSRPPGSPTIHARASLSDTTCTQPSFSAPSSKPPRRPAFPSASPATPSGTRSPPTCSRTAPTSARSKHSSATETSRPR